MKKYQFTIPMGPTVNHYHVPAIKNGKPLITKSVKVKSYQRDIILLIRSLGLHKENISQSVTLSLVFRPKTARKYDVSNFLKAMEDGLVKAGFLEDDHWIEYGFIKKGEKSKSGLVDVLVALNNG